MTDDADTCEACDLTSGEPICSAPATHEHRITPDEPEPHMVICAKHACPRCRPIGAGPAKGPAR